MNAARLRRIVGALAEADGMSCCALNELVRAGEKGLLGEVLRLDGDRATLQIFEETAGLYAGGPVVPQGGPLEVTLGPGLLGAVLDGIGRPLGSLAEKTGDFLLPGESAPAIDLEKRWVFEPLVEAGAALRPGDVIGKVQERNFEHRVMVLPNVSGTARVVRSGEARAFDPIVVLESGVEVTLAQRWPVRKPRPCAGRLPLERPLITGQRIFDFLFPVAEGGTVAVPGGFGTGKTVIEQSLAKFAAADVVVYVGCGERGNEMAEVISELGALRDPRNGRPLLDRTVMVVNTSNMPVAARESSIYLGLTIAEYFRDMGCAVALMADSLSRWAEALREIGARMQEMPGEEGYPTYLASRAAKLHERAGRVSCSGSPERSGSVTLISAVSPPGGDFSEPVTQACLRVAGALWALDPSLAHQRHFPAVDWSASYSLYSESLEKWFCEGVDPSWTATRRSLLELLQREAELREIASVVGPEALEEGDRLLLEAGTSARRAFLAQSAYDPEDAFSPPQKTIERARVMLDRFAAAKAALAGGAGP